MVGQFLVINQATPAAVSCCGVLQATAKTELLTQDVLNRFRFMASKFFHVHHEFRAGKAQQWWETVEAAMAPGG